MNSNLRHVKRELDRLNKADTDYNKVTINVVLDFSRNGIPGKKYVLARIRCSKKLLQKIQF